MTALAFLPISPPMPAASPHASCARSGFVSSLNPTLLRIPMASSPFVPPRVRTLPFPQTTSPRVNLVMNTSSSSSSTTPASAAASTSSEQSSVPTTPSTSSSSSKDPFDLSPEEIEELAEFIQNGPVYRTAKLSLRPLDENDPRCFTDSFQTCMDDWLHMGSILERELGEFSNRVRVYQYYLPIYFWLLRELDRFADRLAADDDALPRPFIMGFCCPQGGGKTTMTTFMAKLLRKMGKSVEIASLDDFYVTHARQNEIAAEHSDNPLMQYRGMPGTHDVPLLLQTLDDLRLGRKVAIPKYDKTAHQGRGDRKPREHWKHISDSTDVVLLEGWCLGFESVPSDILHTDHLAVVNDALKEFDDVYRRIDGLFLIEISNMDWVYEWRLQAERSTRDAGRPGLTDEQVMDFVSRFMPAYKQYSSRLYGRPEPLFPDHELHIEIDQQRRPVHTPRSRL